VLIFKGLINAPISEQRIDQYKFMGPTGLGISSRILIFRFQLKERLSKEKCSPKNQIFLDLKSAKA
jgi:hypothetical protein